MTRVVYVCFTKHAIIVVIKDVRLNKTLFGIRKMLSCGFTEDATKYKNNLSVFIWLLNLNLGQKKIFTLEAKLTQHFWSELHFSTFNLILASRVKTGCLKTRWLPRRKPLGKRCWSCRRLGSSSPASPASSCWDDLPAF